MNQNILVANLIRFFLFIFFMGVVAAIFSQNVYMTTDSYSSDYVIFTTSDKCITKFEL